MARFHTQEAESASPQRKEESPNQPPSPDATLLARLADNDLVLRCLTRAVSRAVQQHKRAGNPIAVWRHGKVVLLAPSDIPEPTLNETQADPRAR